MGEAKRRREFDPKFGQSSPKKWLQLPGMFKKLSTLELFLWTIIIVSSLTTVVWSLNAH